MGVTHGTKSDWEKIEPSLMEVIRPGRYVGHELHAAVKEWDAAEVRFVLAFPDVYEIGMSHVGMGILYHVLNRREGVLAERVYSPWVDMESKMRELGVPLFSLESKKSVRLFDVLGISLQYELQYTNVLNLLDLAGIPFRSSERTRRDPFVIAGGPCAFNPEPLAEFLDAVVLGDGEEAVGEIADVIRESKRKNRNRVETLRELSNLEGVYVPRFYRANIDENGDYSGTVPTDVSARAVVHARIIDSLKPESYPEKPLVPLIEVTHDRFSMEIMRGCTRGCRFCNAGMIYRPVRSRQAGDLVEYAKKVIANTGYDEVSLVSLSSSDYPDLLRLLAGLRDAFKEKAVGISFPSLRPDTFTPQMANLAGGLRKGGLTLAPEAGTQRLRDVINKNNCEEDLIRAVEIAFQHEWRLVKLYFMIGLPTETDDDIEGIVRLVGKVAGMAKGHGGKDIHVSISPFSPKPQTPFQWEGQETLENLENKIEYLKRSIRWRNVKLSWRDPRMSLLETVLARGDRKMSGIIHHAWELGARFDAWTERFEWDRWERAFDALGVRPEMAVKEKSLEMPLPWDHLTKGVSRSYFIQERTRALSSAVTKDCRTSGCRGCGLMEHPECRPLVEEIPPSKPVMKESVDDVQFGRRMKQVQDQVLKRRFRLVYQKGPEARFTSHLDTIRIFHRAFRRANISVVLSRGFHAHPRIATGPPLPLGYTSRSEYMDVDVESVQSREIDGLLNHYLPRGITIGGYRLLSGKGPSLNQTINIASYIIEWKGSMTREELEGRMQNFLERNVYRVLRKKKTDVKEIDIRPYVLELCSVDGLLKLELRLTQDGTARVDEVLEALAAPYQDTLRINRAERVGLYIQKGKERWTPFDIA